MEELQNFLKRYFVLLEEHCLLWEGVAKKVSKSLNGIENLADQLQSATSIGPDVAINIQFPELNQKIIYETLMSLERELVPIVNVIQEIGEATEKLNKLAVLIGTYNDATNFTLDTISLSALLESVHDTRQFYQAQYAGLQTAFRCLDFRENNSILNLRKCFIEDKNLKKHVQRCFLLGKYFLTVLNSEEIIQL